MLPQQIADRIAGFQIVGHFRRLRSRTKQRLDRCDIISGIAMPAIHGAMKRSTQGRDPITWLRMRGISLEKKRGRLMMRPLCQFGWLGADLNRRRPAEVFKGPPRPSSNCYNHGRANNKEEKKPNAVLLIAASLIGAVRLNREEIRSSPSVHSKIADSIRLAEMIQSRLRG